MTWEEIASRWPVGAEHGHNAAKLYAPPEGETFDGVCARVAAALDDLRRTGAQRALVVTHAGPLHAVLHCLFGDREPEMQQVLGVRFLPASITRIELREDGAEIITLNEEAHLMG